MDITSQECSIQSDVFWLEIFLFLIWFLYVSKIPSIECIYSQSTHQICSDFINFFLFRIPFAIFN